jgi:hypothetical protein
VKHLILLILDSGFPTSWETSPKRNCEGKIEERLEGFREVEAVFKRYFNISEHLAL